MNRLSSIANVVSNGPPTAEKAVICCAIRTPVTKAKSGGLKHALAEDMLAPLLREVCVRSKIDPVKVEDICIGNVLQPGAGAISARTAALLAGLPVSTAVMTVNRQCSSGLQAIANIAAAIEAGHISVGIGGGVESMSQFEMTAVMNPEKVSQSVFDHEAARNCLLPMGMTSENVAAKYGITRAMQDAFAVQSHKKAAAAQAGGRFEELVPITVPGDEETHRLPAVVSRDDGIRPETSVERLAKLKPSFAKGGTTTAGNASQVSDGAAVVLLASREAAVSLGLPIIASFMSFATVGVPPEIMGVGPRFAIPRALKQAGVHFDDIDVFELNEAFASQAVWCANELQIPPQKLNPSGGAVALGHPLGCTGARQVATLLPELRRRNGKFGVVSMCIGTGMGAAAVIRLE